MSNPPDQHKRILAALDQDLVNAENAVLEWQDRVKSIKAARAQRVKEHETALAAEKAHSEAERKKKKAKANFKATPNPDAK